LQRKKLLLRSAGAAFDGYYPSVEKIPTKWKSHMQTQSPPNLLESLPDSDTIRNRLEENARERDLLKGLLRVSERAESMHSTSEDVPTAGED
jgi:hypothetical protein